jgi:glycosyltransferase involved in cell wall biosynthesis
MIKLLHISPSYYPAFRFGGPIQSVHLLNKALVKKGVKVDVLTTNAGLTQDQRKKIKDKSKEKPFDSAQGDTNGWVDPSLLDNADKAETSGPAKSNDNLAATSVRVKYLDFVGYEHYNFSLQMVKEIWKVIDDYDLVHITAVWNFPVLAGALISLIKKKPYIISPRGVLHQEALTSKSGLVKKLYFNLFAKHYLQKAAAIHYTSQIEKEKSEQILKHKNSFVIPNGIDISSIALSGMGTAPVTDKKYLLILGRIDRIKGIDILIPAFANIVKKFNDLFLVIAGDDKSPYAKEVRKMVEEKKISNNIIFTGQVTGDDKWVLYKNALMFLLPSYSENFGMSVVEAMACGCPVVISDKIGIYKEIADNNAGIIVKTNVESVEEGILKLLNDDKLRETISLNGKSMVEKFYDIDKVAAQMIKQYTLLI